MIFDYKVINDTGSQAKGTIDALNKEVAISSLQRRGFIILDIKDPERRNLSIEDLLLMFKKARGEELSEDRLLVG